MRKGFTRSIPPPWIRGSRPAWLWRTRARVCRNFASPRPTDGRIARFFSRLAAHCERYTPLTALDEPHGLVLDVTGCAHLFGGEAGLLSGALKDMAALGFSARAALAPNARLRTRSGAFFRGRRFLSR